MIRREYFSFSERTDQFDKAMTELIQKMTRKERSKLISPDSEMHYSHGIKWVTVSSSAPDEVNQMKEYSAEILVNMKDIREHNLEALPTFVNKIVAQMDQSMQKSMFETVSESCDKTGNTVSVKDYETQADVFLAMLKKIEFGVDREGNVSKPSFHLSPEAFETLKKEAKSKGAGFDKEVEKIIQDKSKAALEREKKRIARFKK
jgi:hypothetical protein